MGFPDFLILPAAVHQGINIHFPKTAPAPEQRQQVTASEACGRSEQAFSVPFQMHMVFHHDHAVQNGQQNLLQQDAQSQAAQEGARSQHQAFPHIEPGDFFLFHADEHVNAEFPASFLQNKAHHIIDEPGDDKDHEKAGKSDQNGENPGRLADLLQVLGEDQRMEGEHDGGHQRHGQEVDHIVLCGAEYIAEGKLI